MGSKRISNFVGAALFLAVFFEDVNGQYDDHVGGEYDPFYTYNSGKPKLWCFQCNSNLDKDCAYIQPNDTSSFHYKPCLDTEKYKEAEPFCRKIVQTIKVRDNMEVVIRKCGWVRHPTLECYQVSNEDHEEISCQCFEMGCNGATSSHHLGPLAILVGVLGILGARV